MTPTILALDLSLTCTGVAVARPGQLQVSTITTGTARGHGRQRHILNTIAALLRQHQPDLVVIEDLPAHAGKASATTITALAELHGIVKFYIHPRCPYVLVNVVYAKTYALGKGSGKDTGKEQVLLAVERRYRHLVTITDNNTADAVVLAAMAMHRYGEPLAPVPATHRAAVPRVGWPHPLPVTPPADAGRDPVPAGVNQPALPIGG